MILIKKFCLVFLCLSIIFIMLFLVGKYFYNKNIKKLSENQKIYSINLEIYYELLAKNYSLKDKDRILSIAKNELNLESKNNYLIVIEENNKKNVIFKGVQNE